MQESNKESDRKRSREVNFEPSLDKNGASLLYKLKKSDKSEEKAIVLHNIVMKHFS